MESLDKDKVLLVYYVNVEKLNRENANRMLAVLKNYLNLTYDDSVKWLVVPSNINKVEWINKYNISDEQYDKIQELENNLNNIFDSIKTNNDKHCFINNDSNKSIIKTLKNVWHKIKKKILIYKNEINKC